MLPSECLVSQSNVSEDSTCDNSSRQSSSDYDNSSPVYTAVVDISQRHLLDGRGTLLYTITTTTRRLSRAPEHVGRHSIAGHGLLLQRLIACCVEYYTPTGTQSSDEL